MQDLPLALRKLSPEQLVEVLDALLVVEEAGLQDVSDVSHMCSQVQAAAAKASEQADPSYVTTYMADNEWASTRKKWKENVKPPEDCAAIGCQLLKDKADEATAAAAREAAEADLEAKRQAIGEEPFAEAMTQSKKRCPLEGWLASQLRAGQELQAFADESWKPKAYGDGACDLFQKLEDVPKPIPTPVSHTSSGSGPGAYQPDFCLRSPPPRCKPPPRRPSGLDGDASILTGKSARPQGTVSARCNQTSVITLHIGGAGCGMGLSLWERLMQEHGVQRKTMQKAPDSYGKIVTHFEETSVGRCLPRAVFLDTDADAIKQLRSNDLAPFDMSCVSGQGSDLGEDIIRAQAEKCCSLEGFMMTRAICGAAGSIYGSKLLEQLSVAYGRKLKWSFDLAPPLDAGEEWRKKPSELVDPPHWKAVWYGMYALHSTIEHNDVTTFLDNAALAKTTASLSATNSAEAPPFSDLNKTVARTMAALNSNERFAGDVPISDGNKSHRLFDITTNLVPYPRIHHTVAAFAPAESRTQDPSEAAGKVLKEGALASVDLNAGKSISVAMCCRGLQHSQVVDRVKEWKESTQSGFVELNPVGVHIVCQSEKGSEKGGDCAAFHVNSRAMDDILANLFNKFDRTFSQRHKYMEQFASSHSFDIQEGEWSEAREDGEALLRDYREVADIEEPPERDFGEQDEGEFDNEE